MPRIQIIEHLFVDEQANTLGELSAMSAEELNAKVKFFHEKHQGKDILSDDPDYPLVAALYHEVLRRQLQAQSDFPVAQYIRHDEAFPVNGTAQFTLSRRLPGRVQETRVFESGHMDDGTISFREISFQQTNDIR